MRLSSHLSSSTCNTGTLEAARVSPVFRRRTASSRPRLCGIETTNGADIAEILFDPTACNSRSFEKKSRARAVATYQMEPSQSPFVSVPKAESKQAFGLRRTFNVTRNDHSHHSRHHTARRLQRHRRRTVLRHRLLRRWRTWSGGRDLADIVAAREAVRHVSFQGSRQREPGISRYDFWIL